MLRTTHCFAFALLTVTSRLNCQTSKVKINITKQHRFEYQSSLKKSISIRHHKIFQPVSGLQPGVGNREIADRNCTKHD